jgi:cell pole-organizing protein PopZ
MQMANPSTAQEPSMEEILASIRQIISEDSEPSPIAGRAAADNDRKAAEPPKAEAVSSFSSAASTALPERGPAPSEPMKLPTVENAGKPAPDAGIPASPASAEPPRRVEFAPPSAPRATAELAPPIRGDAERNLLSARSDTAVSGAFNSLAHTILAQNARTLEDLVGEMLRPMLKDWLDENLPSLVERLVKEEIERVSRGRR